MIKRLFPCVAMIAFAAIAAPPAHAHTENGQTDDGDTGDAQRELSHGEQELAELLDGYVAGEPVKCLNRIQSDSVQIITDTALVFRDRQTYYVNRTNSPRFIDEFDVPVFRKFTSRLCDLDQVEFVSRTGGIGGPVVYLEYFTPYTKAEDAVAVGERAGPTGG